MARLAQSISQRLGLRPSVPASKEGSGDDQLQGMSEEDVDQLTSLSTLREIPKAKFLATVALKVYSARQGKKTLYSHVDVYRSVENVATQMREVGVRPGTVCAFALPNTIETIVYFLAVQWVNAVALPIDPELDEETIAGILQRSGAKTFASMDVDEDDRAEDAMYQKLNRIADSVGVIHWHCYSTRNQGVVLDTHDIRAGDTAAWHGGSSDYGVDPDTNAVIIVSDAKKPPLLLPLTHKNITSAAKVFTSTYNLTQNKCTVFTNPVHSVHGMLLLVSTFYSGGSLILVPDGAFNLADTWSYIDNDDMTYLCLSAEQVMSLAETAAIKGTGSGTLGFIRVCPGSVDASSLGELEKILNTPVLESYGTGESSGLSTASTESVSKPGMLGKAVTGCEVAIFDTESRTKLGPNTTGDVAVRGETVPIEGYLNDEEFNKWAKIPDDTGSLWLCTGDRGMLDAEGFLTVSGNSWAARKLEMDSTATSTMSRAMPMHVPPVDTSAADAEAEQARLDQEAEQKRLEQEAEQKRLEQEAEARRLQLEEQDRAAAIAAQRQMELPSNEFQALKRELAAEDPDVAQDLSRDLGAVNDEEYQTILNPDMESKQDLLIQNIKDRAEQRRQEREAEELEKARRYTEERENQVLKERQFMQESEREFRNKIDRVLALSAEQAARDQADRGELFNKLNEVAERQSQLEELFDAQHKQTMDALSVRINQLHREIGQLSELNYLAMSAEVANRSAPMMIELKMDEADAAAISAAAAAEEAKRHSELAKQRALEVCRYSEEALQKLDETTRKASDVTGRSDAVQEVARSAGLLDPPNKQTIVHEVLASAPENLEVVERRLQIDMEEVDRAMASHPSVQKAMAFPVPCEDKPGHDIAVAIMTKPGAKVTDTWLKLHAQSILPALAVPNKWFWVEKLSDGMTRDEVAESEGLIDFASLKNRPAAAAKKVVTAPVFTGASFPQ